jgi:hypothetical protein
MLRRFGNLSALDAVSANANPLRGAVYQRLYGLQIGIPAPASDVMRVRNVIAELRTFTANVAYLCHDFYSNF